MTISEIARHEGITREEVHAILRRALRKYRKEALRDPEFVRAYQHWTATRESPRRPR